MYSNSENVSIIMSVYNETDNMIKQAIKSIINQTHQSFEYIIVLDNPNNTSAKKLILKYKEKDSRIVFIENKKNLGLAKSLNRALELSKFDLIARMDADDISFPNRIDKQIRYLKENLDVDLISGQIEFIDEEGNNIKKYRPIICSEKLINKLLPYINLFTHPTWMFRRKILNDLIGYRDFPSGQDYDFILRAKYFGYKLNIIDDVLLKYRIRKDSISVSKGVLQQKMTLYIQKLFSQRQRNGTDTFNINYIKEMDKSEDFLKYKRSTNWYNYYKKLIIEKKYVRAIIFFLGSFLNSKDQCKCFYNSFKVKLILKFNQVDLLNG